MSTPQDPHGDRPSDPPAWDAPTGYGAPPPGYGPAPEQYGHYGQAPAYGGSTQTSTRAIVALVLAIGSFVVVPLIPAIVALFLARGAREEIDLSGGRVTGDGLVTAAKIISWINIGLTVVGVLLLIAAFGLFASSISVS